MTNHHFFGLFFAVAMALSLSYAYIAINTTPIMFKISTQNLIKPDLSFYAQN